MTQVNFYSKEQIDEREIGEPTDSASSTGSLWARIKNAVARIGSLETADTNNVKKTGTSTVTGTLEVPTTPPTPTSAVNSVYVNDATEGVNNLVHKTGTESIAGDKTFENAIGSTSKNGTYSIFNGRLKPDTTGYEVLMHERYDTPGLETAILVYTEVMSDSRTRIIIRVKNADGTDKNVVIAEGDP